MKQVFSVAAGILLALSLWSAPGWYREWKLRRAYAREAAMEAEYEKLRNLSPSDVIAVCGEPTQRTDRWTSVELDYADRNLAVNFMSAKLLSVAVWTPPGRELYVHQDEEEIKRVLPCLLKGGPAK